MSNLTPAMKQYMEIKNKYRDCVVFFRMGDFYETFYDDAKKTAKALDIALTRRGIKKSGQSIPLAGIPYHSLDNYLSKMIKQGYKIAIVEQMEDPKLAKGVVKRDVVRVVTPGTVIEENIIGKNNNYIASISMGESRYGVSFVDITTGEFFVSVFENADQVFMELSKYRPSETIIPMSCESDMQFLKRLEETGAYISFVSDVQYYPDNAASTIKGHMSSDSIEGVIQGKEIAISSAGALLSYLHETQKNSLSHINRIKFYSCKDYLEMDMTTIRNLELIRSLKDSSDDFSLLNVLNKTLTPMGNRLIKNFLIKPLLDRTKIEERLLSVENLISKPFILEEIRDILKNISDIDRLISRINYGNSNPRDLIFLHGSLDLIPHLKSLLEEMDSHLLERLSKLPDLSEISKLIDDSIMDDPPVSTAEGGFIKEGYDEKLDELRTISRDAKKIMRDIEKREIEATGIRSLKIRYNKVFGYYIDVTKANLDLVPEHYIKKQTLVNSERFITEELKELEEKILGAEEKMISLEQELFEYITGRIKDKTKEIQEVSENVAYVDVLCSFSLVSMKNNYTKPVLTEGYRLTLKRSRHPMVEQLTDFVSNSITIDEDNRVMIITGPNMAGKSVFMRQVALNAIMAQIGCYVPASEAELPITDKLFFRTGAVDDASQGQSTFMVEMSETAQILNNATEKSLIALDEIGRGTSTYDGVAIAWSVAQYLAEKVKAKTMFATHYHVLNNMEKDIKGIKNYNIAIQEKDDKIIFLRKIIEGGTDKSYGIHVAKLAGMPKEVIDKSKVIQFKLENEDEISQKIVIETRKRLEKDVVRNQVEEVDHLIKSRQLTLDDL